MMSSQPRQRLPRPTDRLVLGTSGLRVSPLCIGMTSSPDVISAAFDAGVNFFFLTADLHWPLYEGLRRGLQELLARGPSVRDQIVVGVVSYLDDPLFQYLQLHEVIDSVPGLRTVDLIIAGAVSHSKSHNTRLKALQVARSIGHHGARAIGASFHDRGTALESLNANCLDVHYIRYNTAHPAAAHEIFPHLRADRNSLIFNFKSLMSIVTPERFTQLGLGSNDWLPKATDYYRFVLSQPQIDGVLCSPMSTDELAQLVSALDDRPLTHQEGEYMSWLSTIGVPQYF